MEKELVNLDQKRIIQIKPSTSEELFEVIEFEDEQSYEDWLECESNQLEWQKRTGKDVLRTETQLSQGRGRRPVYEWIRNFRCPFWGSPKPYCPKENSRKTNSLTRKVGCSATLVARKKINEDKVIVQYDNIHNGHDLNSREDWFKMRMSPGLRKWLTKAVACDINYDAIRKMTRLDETTIQVLGGDAISDAEKFEVSELGRLRYQDFNNYKRLHLQKVSRLHQDCLKSLEAYRKNIESDGGISILEEMDERETGKREFYFAFSTEWQTTILRKYSSVLCLDSTHDTCYALDDVKRKAFLYTIVVKHDVAGRGVPVAFMITSSEAQAPLARWLLWLKIKISLESSPIFMIDCSRTEMAAISSAFRNPEIRLCYWHMLRALKMQASSKLRFGEGDGKKRARTDENIEKDNELRKLAVSDFIKIIYAPDLSDFENLWAEYKLKYNAHQNWVNYITKQWMENPQIWWHGNRQGMLGIQTNNYVESWHATLKRTYLKGYRRQRSDILVYRLIREVLPDLRKKVAMIIGGFDPRKSTVAEGKQFERCNEVPSNVACQLVQRCLVPLPNGEGYSQAISVRSFEKNDLYYTLTLNENGSICRCSCPYMTETMLVCKHMYLAERQLGYSISFDTRSQGGVYEDESALLNATEEVSSESSLAHQDLEPENIFSSDDITLFQTLASNSTYTSAVERKEMEKIKEALDAIRKVRKEREGTAWSKRQKR